MRPPRSSPNKNSSTTRSSVTARPAPSSISRNSAVVNTSGNNNNNNGRRTPSRMSNLSFQSQTSGAGRVSVTSQFFHSGASEFDDMSAYQFSIDPSAYNGGGGGDRSVYTRVSECLTDDDDSIYWQSMTSATGLSPAELEMLMLEEQNAQQHAQQQQQHLEDLDVQEAIKRSKADFLVASGTTAGGVAKPKAKAKRKASVAPPIPRMVVSSSAAIMAQKQQKARHLAELERRERLREQGLEPSDSQIAMDLNDSHSSMGSSFGTFAGARPGSRPYDTSDEFGMAPGGEEEEEEPTERSGNVLNMDSHHTQRRSNARIHVHRDDDRDHDDDDDDVVVDVDNNNQRPKQNSADMTDESSFEKEEDPLFADPVKPSERTSAKKKKKKGGFWSLFSCMSEPEVAEPPRPSSATAASTVPGSNRAVNKKKTPQKMTATELWQTTPARNKEDMDASAQRAAARRRAAPPVAAAAETAPIRSTPSDKPAPTSFIKKSTATTNYNHNNKPKPAPVAAAAPPAAAAAKPLPPITVLTTSNQPEEPVAVPPPPQRQRPPSPTPSMRAFRESVAHRGSVNKPPLSPSKKKRSPVVVSKQPSIKGIVVTGYNSSGVAVEVEC